MSFEVHPSQKDQTLPMVLLLRGDELIVDDFTFDTDQAMNFLGIKRSRLSQISGRELRVARIRKDRYVRPVYREADLKDYLDWTRATATHVSSSKAIEQAVENLDDRFNDILQVLNEKLQVYHASQQDWMSEKFAGLPQKGESLPPERDLGEGAWHDEAKLARKQIELLKAVQHNTRQLHERIANVSGRVDLFLPELQELAVAQKSLRRDFQQQIELITNSQKAHYEQLAHSLNRISEDLADIKVLQEKPSEEVAKPIVTPKRRTARSLRSYWR